LAKDDVLIQDKAVRNLGEVALDGWMRLGFLTAKARITSLQGDIPVRLADTTLYCPVFEFFIH